LLFARVTGNGCSRRRLSPKREGRMTEPGKHEKSPNNPKQDEFAERSGARPPLGQQIRARTTRPHKGDVGRGETNEEVFQGSKEKELR
jgi:hypothetical protein